MNILKVGENAKIASEQRINNILKNKVLENFSLLIKKNANKIIFENKKDVLNAQRKGLKENMIKRLELNSEKINQIIISIKEIIKFKDPVNYIDSQWKRPNGLKIRKVTVPLGVIGVIYESRPNVTSDVACLCFKSGNSVILRGGSEAYNSNKIISDLFRKSLLINKVNKNYVQFVKNKDKKIVKYMLSKMQNFIDVIIPRGGKDLVRTVQKHSNVPIIGHLEGVCHTYVDKSADLKMSENIIYNAKLRNTSICGATETVLIHEEILKKFVNPILTKLEKGGCKIYAEKNIKKLYLGNSFLSTKKSWGKEYLSNEVSIKSVKNVNEAIKHINKFGTMHTDAIIASDKKIAEIFLKNVKSSIAIHNSSTQFADGGEFGFGAEIGISTNKLPPRGPVGLNQLVTYKYEVLGKGQIRK